MSSFNMNPDQVVGHLQRTRLFRNLPSSELHNLSEILQPLELQDDELLFREGEISDSFYIVVSGQLEIIRGLDSSSERRMGVLSPGETLGELSIIETSGKRTASVRALQKAHLLKLIRTDFDDLLSRQPSLAYELARELGGWMLARESEAIRDLTEQNIQLQRAYLELEAAQIELVEKEKMERELQLARRIQMSVLPEVLPENPAFEFAARIEPARAVGGDFYDLVDLKTGRVAVLVGDVTDKGVSAALFMAQTFSLLHAAIRSTSPPARVLNQVNRHLLEMNASGLFATVILGMLDPATRRFSYTRAGHEQPLLYRPGRGMNLLPKKLGQAIGIFEDLELDNGSILLPPGSVLLLYSDGVTDETDPPGEPFGMRRFMAVLSELAETSANDICNGIFNALAQHRSGNPQFDDVTLVVVKSKPE
jgi:sigma-B regulation protein RsbU (phosphoserine phosphatase)